MLTLLPCALAILADPAATLRGPDGVEAVFQQVGRSVRLAEIRDTGAERVWRFEGPIAAIETSDGQRYAADGASMRLSGLRPHALTLQGAWPAIGLEVRQDCAFAGDGRTLRVATSLRATREPVALCRITPLDVASLDGPLERVGPAHVSCPIIGAGLFMGIEHPAATTEVDGARARVSQRRDLVIGRDWTPLPPAVIGASPGGDDRAAIKRAFLAYLDTVRVKPADMHIHYNNWWTMPVPFTEADVLANIAELQEATGGRLYDSYAMDMGWSDPRSVWKVNREGYPAGFSRIGDALRSFGCEPGLWVSPSSLYPPALDNNWLAESGFEVSPGSHIGLFACLAKGGRYQREFRDTLLRHAQDAGLAHVKFDGIAWPCVAEDHGHPPGEGSYVAIAEGLMEIFDVLRAQRPDIALEPTCFGYFPSPWWLMHTPYIIGPFGDDSPHGVSPCPEWIESMTTARDAVNIEGHDSFWMPTSALECFDIIVQCEGPVYNHAVMAAGRGHWFQSTYVNPMYMDSDEWGFMVDVMAWAREHREELRDPVLLGGSPRKREPYGYSYAGSDRLIAFIRNPWMESASIELPDWQPDRNVDVFMLYPARIHLETREMGAKTPSVELGPYELAVIELRPRVAGEPTDSAAPTLPAIEVDEATSEVTRIVYDPEPVAFGPNWTSPHGDAPEVLEWTASGVMEMPEAGQVCVLVESPPGAAPAACDLRVDGSRVAMVESGSRGAFAATGAARVEEWQWFVAPLGPGRRRLEARSALPGEGYRCGLYVRGVVPYPAEGRGEFPLPPEPGRPFSAAIAPVSAADDGPVPVRRERREVETIDGLFLDALEWTEATAGWGEVRRNRSIMDQPMTMGSRRYVRGIGAHAVSRVSYDLPEGFRAFEATIGCDQEVWSNSVVFVVEGDGKEIYRSPLMRRNTPVIELRVPIEGVRRLSLILEDGGDGIAADHGNWADARVVR